MDGFAEALAECIHRRFGPGAKIEWLERLSGGASQELWAFDVTVAGGGADEPPPLPPPQADKTTAKRIPYPPHVAARLTRIVNLLQTKLTCSRSKCRSDAERFIL